MSTEVSATHQSAVEINALADLAQSSDFDHATRNEMLAAVGRSSDSKAVQELIGLDRLPETEILLNEGNATSTRSLSRGVNENAQAEAVDLTYRLNAAGVKPGVAMEMIQRLKHGMLAQEVVNETTVNQFPDETKAKDVSVDEEELLATDIKQPIAIGIEIEQEADKEEAAALKEKSEPKRVVLQGQEEVMAIEIDLKTGQEVGQAGAKPQALAIEQDLRTAISTGIASDRFGADQKVASTLESLHRQLNDGMSDPGNEARELMAMEVKEGAARRPAIEVIRNMSFVDLRALIHQAVGAEPQQTTEAINVAAMTSRSEAA